MNCFLVAECSRFRLLVWSLGGLLGNGLGNCSVALYCADNARNLCPIEGCYSTLNQALTCEVDEIYWTVLFLKIYIDQ
jgi:hypothetical protein